MKMKIVEEIIELHNYLMELPYGVRIRDGEKILLPSWSEYSRTVDKVIDKLIELFREDSTLITLNDIGYIQSIRENDVNRALVDQKCYRNVFELYGCDEEMLRISNSIALITNRFSLQPSH